MYAQTPPGSIEEQAHLAMRNQQKVLEAAGGAANPPLVIAIEPPEIEQSGNFELVAWDSVMAAGEADAGTPLPVCRGEDTASIVYTSGTSGAPKGVMLPHRAILANCHGARPLIEEAGLGDEVFLSVLPLSHAYERTAGQFFAISIGAQICYAAGPETFARDIAAVRPTIVTAVPRLLEVIREQMLLGLRRAGGLRQRLFHAALDLGTRRYEGTLPWYQRPADLLLGLLVRRKVAARLGGRLKALISGGAMLPYEVGIFFTALGLRLLQGYGQTEAAPIITCNSPNRCKLHTVGPPLRNVELDIAGDGEVLVRGPLLMTGYWNDPEATAEALKEGWLYTGDVGRLDGDGYLELLDRKKDIIVTSGGKNIPPQRLESLLTLEPEIGQAMVVGDNRPHPAALIVPAREWAQQFSEAENLPSDLARLAEEPTFRHAIEAALARVNRKLSPDEKIRRFAVLSDPFTEENGLLTPTLKIRRHAIQRVYKKRIDELYKGAPNQPVAG
jgi:long-chain acyl-CoA synthetase